MSSLDKDSSTQRTESNDDNSTENDVFSITAESDHIKVQQESLSS
jgi:hypothetical protein